jgi:calcineurin-like phosphoesterase family protein
LGYDIQIVNDITAPNTRYKSTGEQSMIYYTSDLHLGGWDVIHRCHRPFANPEAMDEALIQNWNARVQAEDTVYIVGDLMNNNSDPEAYLTRLAGKKYLIIGNNDSIWMWKTNLKKYFGFAVCSADIDDNGRCVSLCHCPPPAFGGQFLVYGHIHNYPGLQIRLQMQLLGNAFNAGVDVNGYHPVTLDELIANQSV